MSEIGEAPSQTITNQPAEVQVQPLVNATPLEKPVTDPAIIRANVDKMLGAIPKINITPDSLPADLQQILVNIQANKDEVGKPFTNAAQYKESLEKFLRLSTGSAESKLSDEQKNQMKDVYELVHGLDVGPKKIAEGLEKCADAANLTPEEKTQAQAEIDAIKKIAEMSDETRTQQDVIKAEGAIGRLMRMLKTLGALIMGILGIGVFKSMQGGGQQQG